MTARAMEDGHADDDGHHRDAALLPGEAFRRRLSAAARLDTARQGRLRLAGGYVHAGLHALGSLPAFLVAGLGRRRWPLCAAEFAIHYAIDFTKAGISRRSHAGPDSRTYWALQAPTSSCIS